MPCIMRDYAVQLQLWRPFLPALPLLGRPGGQAVYRDSLESPGPPAQVLPTELSRREIGTVALATNIIVVMNRNSKSRLGWSTQPPGQWSQPDGIPNIY